MPVDDIEDAPRPTLPETFVSIDIETNGPHPRDYSILSIGACLVNEPDETFYVELKPVTEKVNEKSLSISGLSMAALAEHGVEAGEAMQQFADWVARVIPVDHAPVFVAFNAGFDWMFMEDYFQRYLGRNPFGHSALDIKAYYMGKAGTSWAQTSMRFLSPRYLGGRHLSHNALGDARDQAELFRALLAEGKTVQQSD
jgi:DNA polymerase III epsilon subunit-like protein